MIASRTLSSVAGYALSALLAGPIAMAAESASLLSGTVAEVEAGRAVAEASCQACHGLDGISRTAKLPHLAGQRAEYLYRKAKRFKRGEIPSPVMYAAVKYLTDDALRDAALFYASLVPYTVTADDAIPTEVDPVAAGEAATAPCAGCHGGDGNSRVPGMPSLTGKTTDYLVAAMLAYKSGARSDSMMGAALASVDGATVENIALFYALQRPEPAIAPVTGDPAAGQEAAAACVGCHGETGNSSTPDVPSLAGQDSSYLAKATAAYTGDGREHAIMKSTVAPLSAADIENISAFFASQAPRPPGGVRKPLPAAEWASKCDRCHGVDGNSIDPSRPALAGQRYDYLFKALSDYQSRADSNRIMHAMAQVLSESEIRNIAAYYARKQPRSIVFVPVNRE